MGGSPLIGGRGIFLRNQDCSGTFCWDLRPKSRLCLLCEFPKYQLYLEEITLKNGFFNHSFETLKWWLLAASNVC